MQAIRTAVAEGLQPWFCEEGNMGERWGNLATVKAAGA